MNAGPGRYHLNRTRFVIARVDHDHLDMLPPKQGL